MSPEGRRRARWWLLAVAAPVLLLAALAIALGSSELDPASLEPFFERETGEFPLRRSRFFDLGLHLGGKYFVLALVLGLIVLALACWRREGRRAWSARLAYLIACVGVASFLSGAWKDLADQITPWRTLRFGGTLPWPGEHAGPTFSAWLGSPGAHAATGFAWLGLYFVGASMRARRRALWLLPGLMLGGLFSLAQHVRGAHPPSHELWSIAVAWGVAAGIAALFRRLGWMDWSEVSRPGKPEDRHAGHGARALLPWLLGASGLFAGTAFFAVDRLLDEIESGLGATESWIEVFEWALMGPGVAVAFYLLAERLREAHERSLRRDDTEREQRLRLLGRTAAAVAHEVRNPLHTLRLIVDEQRHELPALRSHPLRPQLDSCIERIDRAVELVYRLARPRSAEREIVDLARVARESVAALERSVPAGRIAMGQMCDRADVLASPDGLRIVVDNLLRNADEAAAPGQAIGLCLLREGADWRLAISNPGVLPTTPHLPLGSEAGASEKPRGLGLGLAISGQIASDSGARIELAEAGGIVTCVLRWPAASERGS